ncbi:hypothetical protein [Citricoccus muralis]|uniref:Methionine synthase n=1 Tax=Citricoccus muralis TaxID=169134 RepID=A0ABY8H3Q2_9MICC|nr:hypothetical protein [Citricoccus muralis]WFP15646.1 hypothetical protein P8192_09550 [Citricoccus muralis]
MSTHLITATAHGGLPGADPRAAAVWMLSELRDPHLPVLPELHAEGRSDTTGRSAVMLTELPVDRQPYGWRLVSAESVPARRAASWFGQGLDAFVDVAGEQGISVPRLGLRVLGPVSLMARLWLPGGERALRDHGARADIMASWADGVAAQLDRIHRLTGAKMHLVVAEPEALGALTGTIPTASGYRTVRSLDRSEVRTHWRAAVTALCRPRLAEDGLTLDAAGAGEDGQASQMLTRTLIEALPTPETLADQTPSRLSLGLPWAGFEQHGTHPALWDTIAELVESGYGADLMVPSELAQRPGVDPARLAQALQQRWDRLGLDPALLEAVRVCAPDLSQGAVGTAAVPRALDRVRQVAERASQPL